MREKDQNKEQQQSSSEEEQQLRRSGAFNEPNRGDEKSTDNLEQLADLEQQRKDALTERD